MIGFILLLIFLILLGKALFETAWGSCLIIGGVCCQILAHMLYALAYGLETVGRLRTAVSNRYTMTALIAAILAAAIVPAPAENTTATAAGTLPTVHTITDLKGRSMEGTIVAKTETSISFVRAADQKKFEIKLDTLSEADRTFVAGLVQAPIKKPTMLFIGWTQDDKLIGKLNAEFDVHAVWQHEDRAQGSLKHTWPELEKMTEDELKAFNCIWITTSWGNLKTFPLPTLAAANQIIVCRNSDKVPVEDFLKGNTSFRDAKRYQGAKPYVLIDGNLIRYCDFSNKWDSKTKGWPRTGEFPEITDQVITEAKKLQAGAYPPK